jgi:cob(I)alamin adenosyltransferase
MVRLDRITTRGGDDGETSLGDGTRLRKDATRIAAIGTVDEANAALGLLRLHTEGLPEIDAMLGRIQNDLFDLGADLATPEREGATAEGGRKRLRLAASQVTRLDQEIAALNAGLPPLRSFVLPGGTPAAAHAHLARTIARRAERETVRLAAEAPLNPALVPYLNRLSDLLFVLSRVCNAPDRDVLWQPAATQARERPAD